MKSKIIIYAAFLLLFFSATVFAQETHLWKVTSKNGKHTSYLYGTMHFFGESFYNKYPVLDKSLMSSDMVVTEMEMIRKTAENYGNPTDEAEKILNKEQLNLVKEIFKNEKTDFRRFNPSEMAFKLQMKFNAKNCIYLNPSDEYYLDQYIQKKGKENNKKMYYLETIDQQINYLNRVDSKASDSVTWKSAAFGIKAILRQYNKSKNTCLGLVEKYGSFKISYEFDKSCENINDHQAIIRKERNEKWMKILPELFENNNVFVAVGLGHFHYQCGLIQELKKLGYSVEPVSMK